MGGFLVGIGAFTDWSTVSASCCSSSSRKSSDEVVFGRLLSESSFLRLELSLLDCNFAL